eukprot:10585979-Karenia_brevis.AAC.1
MGATAVDSWEAMLKHAGTTITGDATPVSFALDNEFCEVPAPQFADSHKLREGRYPIAAAWWHLAWHCTIAELSR